MFSSLRTEELGRLVKFMTLVFHFYIICVSIPNTLIMLDSGATNLDHRKTFESERSKIVIRPERSDKPCIFLLKSHWKPYKSDQRCRSVKAFIITATKKAKLKIPNT